ncbi:MAG: amidase [Pseudonocardiales bacterium]|nr:amidase [Pseudonocardiales bacterium]
MPTALTATALVDAFSRRTLSPVEVARAALARIERLDGAINAFVTVTAERALEDAARAEGAYAAGAAAALAGVPYTLKDLLPTRGIPTGYGSRVFCDPDPPTDAPVAARLRASGGVLLGKTTTPELGWKGDSGNSLNGPCHNPWRQGRTAGGSSGGAAAAAAAGFGPLHQGSDGAGSIRIPAAFSGITGLRPTFGVISTNGVFPLSRSLDTVGPMARSAADATQLFEALSGFDQLDSRSEPFRPVGTVPVDLAAVRIGVPPGFFFDECDPQIAQRVTEAIEHFRARGATVVDLDLPLAEVAHRGFTLLIRAEALSVHAQRLADRPDDFSPDVRDRLRLGEQLSGKDVALLVEDMHRWKQQLRGVFAEQVDLIMTPTAQCEPPLVTDAKFGRLPDVTRLTYPWSFGHVPAISVPCGFTDAGLPVGLQIVGPPHADRTLLDVAGQYQARTSWHRARPGAVPDH